MYVRSKSFTTGVLPPQMRVRGGVRTLQRSASWCPLRTRWAAHQIDLVERLLQMLLVHVVYMHVYSHPWSDADESHHSLSIALMDESPIKEITTPAHQERNKRKLESDESTKRTLLLGSSK
jgi:hypothetical protein